VRGSNNAVRWWLARKAQFLVGAHNQTNPSVMPRPTAPRQSRARYQLRQHR